MENNKTYTLKEVVNNTVAKNRQAWIKEKNTADRPAKAYLECLACLSDMNFDKELNKLTCSTICGLWLQRQILEAETDEQAKELFNKLGLDFDADPNALDEYFGLEFKDPLNQFSTARMSYEWQQEKKGVKA